MESECIDNSVGVIGESGGEILRLEDLPNDVAFLDDDKLSFQSPLESEAWVEYSEVWAPLL